MKSSNLFRLRKLALLVAIVVLFSATDRLQSADDEYRIENVAENVYRFTAGHYHSIFVVTREGILITDPINPDAAKWLKSELAERFESPVRYLVYSHNHFDHTLGGHEFSDPKITCIAHRLAREDLRRTKTDTRLPNVTFEDELTIHLADTRIRLRYHGTNNGRGSVSMKIDPADVMFVVDWIVLGRMPYKDLKGYDIHGMINSTGEILDTDFTTFVGGHANIGKKADVARYLAYLEALYESVVDGRRRGLSLEELKSEIRLDEFRDLVNYEEWLPLNVEGVYRTLDDQSYLDLQESQD